MLLARSDEQIKISEQTLIASQWGKELGAVPTGLKMPNSWIILQKPHAAELLRALPYV